MQLATSAGSIRNRHTRSTGAATRNVSRISIAMAADPLCSPRTALRRRGCPPGGGRRASLDHFYTLRIVYFQARKANHGAHPRNLLEHRRRRADLRLRHPSPRAFSPGGSGSASASGASAARRERTARRARLGAARGVFGQRRALRDPCRGSRTCCSSTAFSRVVATAHIAVQEWTGIHFLRGTYYLGYSLLSDVFGLLAIAGLVVLLWRRAVVRPARLHSVLDDWIALGLLLLVFVQGFVVEGLRIATTELAQQPELARWSPGGGSSRRRSPGWASPRSAPRTASSGGSTRSPCSRSSATSSSGKLAHAFYGTANMFLRNLGSTGRLVHADVDALAESDPDALEQLGTSDRGFSGRGCSTSTPA